MDASVVTPGAPCGIVPGTFVSPRRSSSPGIPETRPSSVARVAAATLALSLLSAPLAAAAAPKPGQSLAGPRLDVKSWQLDNGLKVLFLANHEAPVATVQIFYHVGSKDEHVGNRGVAHMFEHLMFKGSEHVPPEAHARLLKEVGGQVNAFTTEDVTAYRQTVPPSYVDFAVKLEAERLRGLRLFPATVDSERKVVEEEKRLRIDNIPVGQGGGRGRGRRGGPAGGGAGRGGGGGGGRRRGGGGPGGRAGGRF